MTIIQNAAIPKGSTVLVTGVNGYIGSHVADQFLQLGFRVRGTARDTTKSAWVTELFNKKYGSGLFELVAVPDMVPEGAFSSAVKRVSAIIHVASNVTFNPDPTKVIPTAVDGALSALKAANSESTVKRFVLTASSFAASMASVDKEKIVTKDSWNEQSIRDVQAGPPYPPNRGIQVYAASKALAEKAVWEFCHEDSKRPDLVVNTVLPSANFGKSLDLVNQGHASTSGFIKSLWHGTEIEWLSHLPPHYFIDVQDVARLHVAAANHPAVAGERIFGYAERYNYNMILDTFRKQNPGKDFIENFQSERDLSVIEPRAMTEQLLKELGRPGFTSLEESIQMNSEGLH